MESFDGRLRDELLGREQVDTLWELIAQVECWRQIYNELRPHGVLGSRPLPCT